MYLRPKKTNNRKYEVLKNFVYLHSFLILLNNLTPITAQTLLMLIILMKIKIGIGTCNAVTYRATGLAAVFYFYFSLLEHNEFCR